MTTQLFEVKNLVIGDGVPKICVPINGRNRGEIMEQLALALDSPCDLLEWRADFYLGFADRPDWRPMLDEIRNVTQKPLIFTLRSESEGGISPFRRSDYLAILRDVMESGDVDFVDVEFFEEDGSIDEAKMEFLSEIAHANEKRIIFSNHDFDKTPDLEAIVKRLNAMATLGADLPKVAYMPREKQDVYTLLEAARIFSQEFMHKPFIAISMGELGKETRVCGGIFGSAISFASPPSKAAQNSTAPGQMAADELARCICEYYKTGV